MSTAELQNPKLLNTLEEILDSFDVDDAPELVLKLVGESETGWIKEGSDPASPERLSMPGICRIVPTCQIALFKDEKKSNYNLKTIRYIAGCPSLDLDYQKENGYEPDVNADNIWIERGSLSLKRVGSDIAKYDYLKLYQGNVSNPYRPPTAEDEYEEIIEVIEAENKNIEFETEFQAYELIRKLRKPVSGGLGFEYDEEQINLYSIIFNLGQFPSPEEKFRELGIIAKTQPSKIIDSIVNFKKGTYADVKQAEDLGVIKMDDEKAYLVADNTVILPYDRKYSSQTKINKLVDFLLTESGAPFSKQISILVEAAKQKLL